MAPARAPRERRRRPALPGRARQRPLLALVALSAAGGPRLAAGDGAPIINKDGQQLLLVPEDDLTAFEAFEYAMLRINEMRKQCTGFHLAPLEPQNYHLQQVRLLKHPAYMEYFLHIKPTAMQVPPDIHVHIARQQSVTDISLFQVTNIDPPPCDLYSGLDDAELLVPWHGGAAERAQHAAIQVLNNERAALCPQKPQLQLVRAVAATLQPAEGAVVRLALELREAATDFHSRSFVDKVFVVYALDHDVPERCTVSPEVYPARPPCAMRYFEGEESAGEAAGFGNSSSASSSGAEASSDSTAEDSRRLAEPVDLGAFRSLREIRRSAAAARRCGGAGGVGGGVGNASASSGAASSRRLQSGELEDLAAPSRADMRRRFKDKGLEIPDNFDPRLERTICFPRGFSRSQGSCGASWAFAATAVASFRECLLRLRRGDVGAGLRFLSAQELTSCVSRDGCSGGTPALAFYRLKRHGVAREACSPYRMRCYSDNSQIAVGAADAATSRPQSKDYDTSSKACPATPDPKGAPCKCLSEVYHPTRTADCELLPSACSKAKVPHYFSIAGTEEGNTVPQLERHMMQELLSEGPLYVSMLLWEDFYDPVSWTESGIYIHKRGALIGKHAVTCVGWGTDANSRDYWLLLNSFGNGWQQEGYFKVMRGETTVAITKYGAWGVDWSRAGEDLSKPTIAEVEVSYSPEMHYLSPTGAASKLAAIWLQVSAITDEPARMLVRVQGLESTVVGQAKDTDFLSEHVLKIDLLKIGLLGERAKIQIWAADEAENTESWGPFSLQVFSKEAFAASQSRRLAEAAASPEAATSPAAVPAVWT